jgi:hypothetical protein
MMAMLKSTTGVLLALFALDTAVAANNPAVTVAIDVNAARHAINPMIYGVNFGTPAELKLLNAPLNRSGGNNMTTYNWRQNVNNLDSDYFFESYPLPGAAQGQAADSFVSQSKGQRAQPMLTVPMIGWVAKLGPGRAILPSFSVAKYGPQCSVDPYDDDAGNGVMPDCSTDITGNDPHDAYVADSPANERAWIQHLIAKWGKSTAGGVNYYLMDNESGIWYSTHRDIHPVGPHGVEIRDDVIATSKMIKALDPGAKIVAPEEWGWYGYQYDGYDQQYTAALNNYSYYPDRSTVQGGLQYIPWLLKQWKAAGHPIDVLSVHFYPQGNEYTNKNSLATQQLRNRSTRQLWDPKYVSESYIGAVVDLIPVLKGWVNKYYYAGTPVAVTEYNWGDEAKINGATTQADIFGIFGRQGLDMATRWTVPASNTPTFKAMQIYRNYDGHDSGFGDVSVQATVPNPDRLSAFAAQRTVGRALTVMVINKIAGATPVTLGLGHFTASGTAGVYQLTATNAIKHLAGVKWSRGKLIATVPAQSVTLFVLPE